MYIRSLDRFLKPLEEDPDSVIGFQLSKSMNYCAGVTYILPSKGLYKAVKEFYTWLNNEKENTEEFIKHTPEDWAITRCVTSVNDYTMYQWNNHTTPSNWLMSPFNFREIEADGSISSLVFSKYCMYDFVNFGNRYELDKECKCSKLLQEKTPRELAGEVMQKFTNFDLLNLYQG